MSELTKEKIYKKELEKVGGEGNNNLERIRSLGPYATVEYVNTLMSGALKRAIVEELPTTDIDTNTIYMVLDSEASSGNVYNEYLYINEAWELIGTTEMETPHLYKNTVSVYSNGVDIKLEILSNTPFTLASQYDINGFKTWLKNNNYTYDINTMKLYNTHLATGSVVIDDVDYIVIAIGVYATDDALEFITPATSGEDRKAVPTTNLRFYIHTVQIF